MVSRGTWWKAVECNAAYAGTESSPAGLRPQAENSSTALKILLVHLDVADQAVADRAVDCAPCVRVPPPGREDVPSPRLHQERDNAAGTGGQRLHADGQGLYPGARLRGDVVHRGRRVGQEPALAAHPDRRPPAQPGPSASPARSGRWTAGDGGPSPSTRSPAWTPTRQPRPARRLDPRPLADRSLHHLRDVSYGEDASQIRTSSGPQAMATCATWPWES